MRPYIYARRNGHHIIDVRESMRGLLRAKNYLTQVASRGDLVLFVATKRQARQPLQQVSLRCAMPFVAHRWLGGTLTNFRTIHDRLNELQLLEEQQSLDPIRLYSKRMHAAMNRKYRRTCRTLGGIRGMDRLPGCVVVVDPVHEETAVRESRRLGIPVVALIDSDGDPDAVDLPIPGNDDSVRSIELILNQLADAVLLGQADMAA